MYTDDKIIIIEDKMTDERSLTHVIQVYQDVFSL